MSNLESSRQTQQTDSFSCSICVTCQKKQNVNHEWDVFITFITHTEDTMQHITLFTAARQQEQHLL